MPPTPSAVLHSGDTVMYRESPEKEETGPYVVVAEMQSALAGDRGTLRQDTHDALLYRVVESDETYAARVAQIVPLVADPNRTIGDISAILSRRRREKERRGHDARDTQLRLVSRGNVWALYHDPKWMQFASDEEEIGFWAQDGLTRSTVNSIYPGISFDEAWKLFVSGKIDLIAVQTNEARRVARTQERGEKTEPEFFSGRRLHDCFAKHRERVRALTLKRY